MLISKLGVNFAAEKLYLNRSALNKLALNTLIVTNEVFFHFCILKFINPPLLREVLAFIQNPFT